MEGLAHLDYLWYTSKRDYFYSRMKQKVRQNISLFWPVLNNGSKWRFVLITLVLAYAETSHTDSAPDPWGSLVPSTTGRMTDR